jgi:hypothetical protein
MRKSLTIIGLLLVLSLSGFCQSDTISYWHVVFNDKLVYKFSETSENPSVNLKYTEINKDSELTIKYYRDTPCNKCPTYLAIRDITGKTTLTVKGKGTANNMTIQLYKLVKNYNYTHTSSFRVYYLDSKFSDQLLFTLTVN